MRWSVLLAALLVAGVTVNVVYTAWAVSSPLREEWVLYLDLSLPAQVAAANSRSDVQGRLERTGYVVAIVIYDGSPVVEATHAGDPDYRAGFWGLGQAEGGSIVLDLRCTVGYLRVGCGDDAEGRMRDRLGQLLRDSEISLSPDAARFGDYDFALNREFGLAVGQVCLGGLTVMALLAVYAVRTILLEVRRDRSPDSSQAGGKGLSPPLR